MVVVERFLTNSLKWQEMALLGEKSLFLNCSQVEFSCPTNTPTKIEVKTSHFHGTNHSLPLPPATSELRLLVFIK